VFNSLKRISVNGTGKTAYTFFLTDVPHMLATQEDPHIICDAAEFANLKFTLLSLHSTIVGQPKVQSLISYFAQAGFLAQPQTFSSKKF
jgi:hypothetical protein